LSGSQSAVDELQIPESSTAIKKANWDGWALITNPFPCGLNVAQFASDNGIDVANIRIWDRTASGSVDNYQYQRGYFGYHRNPNNAIFLD